MTLPDEIKWPSECAKRTFKRSFGFRDGRRVVKYEVRPEHREELARIERETGKKGIYAIFGELFPRVRRRMCLSDRIRDAMVPAMAFIKALLDAEEINKLKAKSLRLKSKAKATQSEVNVELSELNVELSEAGLPTLVVDTDDWYSQRMSRAKVYEIVKSAYKQEGVPLPCASNQTRFWRRWIVDSGVGVIEDPEHPNLVQVNVKQLQGVLDKLNDDDRDELFGQ